MDLVPHASKLLNICTSIASYADNMKILNVVIRILRGSQKSIARNCCIVLNQSMQRHSANWLMVFFFLWCYLFFSSFEVYSYKNDQFDNLISFWKESAFKMHSKRKVVWIALVTSLSCHCLVIVLYVYMYLSKIFQYVQMWLSRLK